MADDQKIEDYQSLVFLFLCGSTTFVLGLLTFISGQSLVNDIRLSEQSVVTQGHIIQRVREPNGELEHLHYLRYRFENAYSTQNCRLDAGTLTTPSDRACAMTIRRIKVREDVYKATKIPTKVDVLYLPSSKRTWSKPMGYGLSGLGKFIVMFLFAIASLVCSGFTLKFYRLGQKT